jgi:hypothetical protein
MESKWFEAQGQYFLWEPVDNYIPEMELAEGPCMNSIRHKENPISRPGDAIQRSVRDRRHPL